MKKITDERDASKEAFEETGISFEDVLADQDQEEPNFIEDDITLEEPLTYSRDAELSKQDLEEMKNIFTQNENEILDVPTMQNRVHTKKID